MNTLELIDLLKKETQKYNEKLAYIFPERLLRVSDSKLSIVWNINVNKLKKRIRKGSYITQSSIEKLEEGLKNYLGENTTRCYELISEFKKGDINALNFIMEIKKEIAKYSNFIELENKEFSILFFGNERYLTYLKQKINNIDHPQYNPNYKLSTAQLKYFKKIIYIIDENASQMIDLINSYIKNSPNLREYSYQQFDVSNPHIFDNINTVDKAYWFGFLCADGSLNIDSCNKYEIRLELSNKDRFVLVKFANFIGFNPLKIKDRYRFLKNKDGITKRFKMSFIRFLCKPMGMSLLKNGIFGSNSVDHMKRVPSKIRHLLKGYKSECNHQSYNLREKIGLGWLLGYFDGNGTVHKDRKGKNFSGEIISSSKALLKDIKEVYDIDYPIGFKDKEQNTYRLSIGTKLYKTIMNNYTDSMHRKMLN